LKHLKERKLHALTDSIDISTITIENMPGGTPWGQIVEAATRTFIETYLNIHAAASGLLA
jgi:hypothetical protein